MPSRDSGSSSMVPCTLDNENVSEAMGRFATCLEKNCGKTQLQNLSLELANACTLSLSEDWNHKFKDYKKLVAERRKP